MTEEAWKTDSAGRGRRERRGAAISYVDSPGQERDRGASRPAAFTIFLSHFSYDALSSHVSFLYFICCLSAIDDFLRFEFLWLRVDFRLLVGEELAEDFLSVGFVFAIRDLPLRWYPVF